MADLRKIGRKSSKISQQGWSHVPHSTAPSPQGKYTSGTYFLFYQPLMVPYLLS